MFFYNCELACVRHGAGERFSAGEAASPAVTIPIPYLASSLAS